jgi:deoxyadenosine/deoxycytidine kinase
MTTSPEIYDDFSTSFEQPTGLYVALSGNTSAGKSSLIDMVAHHTRMAGLPAVGISERIFHHRYLRLMFSKPTAFAFPIQLSFMLERYMVLVRNLHLGRIVIIERPHLDDSLFVQEHYDRGHISPAEKEAYCNLTKVLHRDLPLPDILVLMNPTPECSLRRLNRAETAGHRPREFPNEAAKEEWVYRWHDYYAQRHDEYRVLHAEDPEFAKSTLIDVDPSDASETIAQRILALITSQIRTRSRR